MHTRLVGQREGERDHWDDQGVDRKMVSKRISDKVGGSGLDSRCSGRGQLVDTCVVDGGWGREVCGLAEEVMASQTRTSLHGVSSLFLFTFKVPVSFFRKAAKSSRAPCWICCFISQCVCLSVCPVRCDARQLV